MKMIDLSVIVPCFNEEKNVEILVLKLLDLFNKNIISGEIILIDDGSFDDTYIDIKKLSKQFKNVIGIEHGRNLGITEAWKSGLKNSQGRYVVTIDADLQYNPKDIELLYETIIKVNCDLVQGWRREYKDRDLLRKFLSKSLNYILNILFLTRVNDIKSGFVMYKREVFIDILKESKKYNTFQHYFTLCAIKRGYIIKQVPVIFYPRMRGESFIKHPLFFSLKVLLEIPKAILDFEFRKH